MKTLRCISRAATGLLHVHLPAYGKTVADGDEFPVENDDVAKAILSNPNFEEVVAPPARKPAPAPSEAE